MDTTPVTSSWVESLRYVPVNPEHKDAAQGMDGFLLIRAKTGRTYIYGIKAWAVGLIMAHRSKGRALNFVMSGRWPRVKVPMSASGMAASPNGIDEVAM